jgi:hypothetical protein
LGRLETHTKFFLESLKGRDHMEGLSIGGSILLKLMFGNMVGGYEFDSSGSRYGPVPDSFEHGNKTWVP